MRLNTGYRAEIVRAAIEAAFAKEEKKLVQREHSLAKRCYEAVVSPKIRRALAELPPSWLNHSGRVCLNVVGMTVCLATEHQVAVPLKFEDDRNYNDRIGAISEGALAKEILVLIAEKEDMSARKRKAQATVEALVLQHTTTDEIAKAWPEGKAFWKSLERKIPVSNLPAVGIEELNSMLGLAQSP